MRREIHFPWKCKWFSKGCLICISEDEYIVEGVSLFRWISSAAIIHVEWRSRFLFFLSFENTKYSKVEVGPFIGGVLMLWHYCLNCCYTISCYEEVWADFHPKTIFADYESFVTEAFPRRQIQDCSFFLSFFHITKNPKKELGDRLLKSWLLCQCRV